MDSKERFSLSNNNEEGALENVGFDAQELEERKASFLRCLKEDSGEYDDDWFVDESKSRYVGDEDWEDDEYDEGYYAGDDWDEADTWDALTDGIYGDYPGRGVDYSFLGM